MPRSQREIRDKITEENVRTVWLLMESKGITRSKACVELGFSESSIRNAEKKMPVEAVSEHKSREEIFAQLCKTNIMETLEDSLSIIGKTLSVKNKELKTKGASDIKYSEIQSLATTAGILMDKLEKLQNRKSADDVHKLPPEIQLMVENAAKRIREDKPCIKIAEKAEPITVDAEIIE